MVKKVYKYATGEAVPNGAVYLTTVVENNDVGPLRLVWHYFLVDVRDD